MLVDVHIRPVMYPMVFDKGFTREDVWDYDYFDHPRTGVYVGWDSFGLHIIEPHSRDWCSPKSWENWLDGVKQQEHTLPMDCGVCDSEEQFIERYCPALDADPRKFCVVLGTLLKEDQPSAGGWRWHKWGPYLGDKKPQYEYLHDEGEDITQVTIFAVYEIVGSYGEFINEINNVYPAEFASWFPLPIVLTLLSTSDEDPSVTA